MHKCPLIAQTSCILNFWENTKNTILATGLKPHSGQGMPCRCVVAMVIIESRSGRGVQHYVIKFVSDLRQVGGFLSVFRFPPPIKLIAFVCLFVCLFVWWYLTSLSTIFQLYRSDQFYWWRKPDDPEKTDTDPLRDTFNTLIIYHNRYIIHIYILYYQVQCSK
jgi:hypothetical protein